MEARWTLPQTPGGIIVGVSPETRSDRQEVVPVMGGCAMSGLGWLLMTLGMLGFWALVAVLAVALLRRPGRPGQLAAARCRGDPGRAAGPRRDRGRRVPPAGLFRYYWVLFKLVINVVATIVLLLYMQTLDYLAGVAAAATLSSSELRGLRSPSSVLHAGAALLLLLVATTLAIYKPGGMTRYGQRKQHPQRTLLVR
jgi:hypothetical protein